MKVWAVCDRCGFEYSSRTMRRESTGMLVCRTCNDGRYDRLRHPQNRPAKPRLELQPDEKATPPIDTTPFLATQLWQFLVTEKDELIRVITLPWKPA